MLRSCLKHLAVFWTFASIRFQVTEVVKDTGSRGLSKRNKYIIDRLHLAERVFWASCSEQARMRSTRKATKHYHAIQQWDDSQGSRRREPFSEPTDILFQYSCVVKAYRLCNISFIHSHKKITNIYRRFLAAAQDLVPCKVVEPWIHNSQ